MKFKEAFEEMKSGIPVKLPSWAGYWWWDEESQTILMYTKDGGCLDIRETQNVEYTLQNILSDEWVYADSRNCPILGGEATFSFGEAIKYLKRGMKVARKGWNGKKQYIQLASGISYIMFHYASWLGFWVLSGPVYLNSLLLCRIFKRYMRTDAKEITETDKNTAE